MDHHIAATRVQEPVEQDAPMVVVGIPDGLISSWGRGMEPPKGLKVTRSITQLRLTCRSRWSRMPQYSGEPR